MRYRARIRFEGSGREIPLLPRSKKRTTFDSAEAALKALEQAGRRLACDAQGRVLSTDGELITTIAI